MQVSTEFAATRLRPRPGRPALLACVVALGTVAGMLIATAAVTSRFSVPPRALAPVAVVTLLPAEVSLLPKPLQGVELGVRE